MASARLEPLAEEHVEHHIGAKGAPRAGGADRVVAELAERQHGVVAWWQLKALGVGRGAIAVRVRRGSLHPVHRGVYAVGYRADSRHGRFMAAVLAAGPAAVLSHRSAGSLWGLVQWSGAIEVTRPTRARERSPFAFHRAAVPDDERTVLDGIPATTAPRTVLDLAAVEPRRRLERAVNELEVRRLTDANSISVLLERHRGRRGTAVLRDLLSDEEALRGIPRQKLEERFLAVLDVHGVSRPRLNADLAIRGRVIRPDCAWPGQRLVVELDGRAAHGTRRAFESDRERDRILLADGWNVMRVTWRQLHDDEAAVVTDLRRILAAGRGAR